MKNQVLELIAIQLFLVISLYTIGLYQSTTHDPTQWSANLKDIMGFAYFALNIIVGFSYYQLRKLK